MSELHVISTGKQSLEELTSIIRDIHTYIDWLHLREKTWTSEQLKQAIDDLAEAGIPRSKVIVNTDADTAYEKMTGGVQLTYESMDAANARHLNIHWRIGCSVHSVQEAVKAEANGADYVLYGHVFASGSKPGMEPRGLENLRHAVRSASVPVIAIGGIAPENVHDVLDTGASGVAVLSGILLADNPVDAVQRYKKALTAG
ncbi:thiazole tautomerase TenI [Barrientosiimonas marina]|uniref:Thiamine phosphate synthase n=1 Tax=Lentibacillus kimchii TaxID=1542911 RepID=A0ABW2UXI4_9BACI